MEHAVFLMKSIHTVLKAEKTLRERGVPAEVVVTPREISSDCGMVVRVEASEVPRAREALSASGLSGGRLFSFADGTYREETSSREDPARDAGPEGRG